MSPRHAIVFGIFFISGVSGLVYEVVWVRLFGLLFGSTVYSAALVIGIYMCGLGVGGWWAGARADRAYRDDPLKPLRWYGAFELGIAALGALSLFAIPAFAELSARVSHYVVGANGWYELDVVGSLARYACAALLLTPITFLMGGTLTLLIRFLVANEVGEAGWRIGALYGVNTAGAALGCLLTDTLLVPFLGLERTQLVAISGNVVAAAGAFLLARGARLPRAAPPAAAAALDAGVLFVGAAVAAIGFASMAMQIVWFRHLTSLYGPYRPIFSLLLAVILVGIWLGSLLGGWIARRSPSPRVALAFLFAVFGIWTLVALALLESRGLPQAVATESTWRAWLAVYGFILKEVSWVVGAPALLAGAAFPLANAIVQRSSGTVGTRAGFLYLANTAGGVAGSFLAGFVLLPALGVQATAGVAVTGLLGGLLALLACEAFEARGARAPRAIGTALALLLVTGIAWFGLPRDLLQNRTLPNRGQTVEGVRQLAVREGVNETLAVFEVGFSRLLLANGYALTGTSTLGQRYMAAFVHVPMLLRDGIETVMVMCFGVGNTAHAVLVHPAVKRMDVVDISRDVLEQSPFFEGATGEPLSDPRTRVYVNDARDHLRKLPEETYDLITGEPPPLPAVGVGALYSREFFELARGRLRPGGMLTYWYPLRQVGEAAALAAVRAFIDVFPDAVLLVGHGHNLMLIGSKDGPVALDPDRVRQMLAASPALQRELTELSLGSVVELAGMIAGGADTLRHATLGVKPLRDDRPLLEYHGQLFRGDGKLPPDLFEVGDVAGWCPRCTTSLGTTEAEALASYLEVTGDVYTSREFLEGSLGAVQGYRPELSERGELALSDSFYLRQLLGRLAPAQEAAQDLRRNGGPPYEAVRLLRSVLERQPNQALARTQLAELYLDLGKPKPARYQLERVLRREPENARALLAWERLGASEPMNGDGPEHPGGE